MMLLISQSPHPLPSLSLSLSLQVQQFEDAFSQQFGQGVAPKLQCYYAKVITNTQKPYLNHCLAHHGIPSVCGLVDVHNNIIRLSLSQILVTTPEVRFG